MQRLAILLITILAFSACSPRLSIDENWAEGNWILTELKDVPVQISGNTSRDAHIEFRPSSRRYEGFGGCNRISGTYTVNRSRINFTPASARLSGCPDVPFENTFLSLLNEVDRYELDGNMMILRKGRDVLIRLQRK